MALIEFVNDQAPYINANNLNNNFTECNNIIESGNNENGRYIKYSDGTMICYGEINTTVNSLNAWGNVYGYDITTVYPFAEEFITKPKLEITNIGGAAAMISRGQCDKSGITQISIVRGTNPGPLDFVFAYIAIGNWK